MRLIDIYHKGAEILRRGTSLLRFNFTSESGRRTISSEAQNQALRFLQQVEIPEALNKSPNASENNNSFSQPEYCSPNPYSNYRCSHNSPLDCPQALQTLQATSKAKFCSKCAFPLPLSPNHEIRGKKGIYQIESFLGKRDIARLYKAIKKNDGQVVVVQEYIFPPLCFTDKDNIKQRLETFAQLANLNSLNRNDCDFRIFIPQEAIADFSSSRAYLIIQGDLNALPSLKTFLAEQGAMSEGEVNVFLDQVLQSLEYLHSEKFQLLSGQIQQGLIHGNINLDSLLIKAVNKNFLIYLADLYMVRELFIPDKAEFNNKSVSDDLKDLGAVAVCLLKKDFQESKAVDIKEWPPLQQETQNFLLKLLGVKNRFENATLARKEILNIINQSNKTNIKLTTNEGITSTTQPNKPPNLLLFLLAGGVMTLLVYFIIKKLFDAPKPSREGESEVLVKKINDEPNVPEGIFQYITQGKATASYIFLKPGFLTKEASLMTKIQNLKSTLVLKETSKLDFITEDFIKTAVTSKDMQVEFAIVSDLNNFISDGEIKSKVIAYNALLVVVPNSSQNRKRALIEPLEGKITLEQLRELYTGNIQNWQQLKGPDLPVKLFIPNDPSIVRIFEELVLKDEESIKKFNKLQKEGKILKLEPEQMLRVMKENFEKDSEQSGGIGFAIISNVFQQCSVYPLAIAAEPMKPVQAFWFPEKGESIDPKNSDLCKKYHKINEDNFREKLYPLTFSMKIVYQYDNQREVGEKFVKMLKTEQGQCLLSKINLIPLQPVDCRD